MVWRGYAGRCGAWHGNALHCVAGRGTARRGFIVIEIELPFPPSVNHYYRRVGPRTILSREGRAYREKVAGIAAGLALRPVEGPLEAEVLVFPPDRRRRDLDNLQKAIFDSLQHAGVYQDDSQIATIHIERCEVVPGGRAIVRISRTDARRETRQARGREGEHEGNGRHRE